MNRLPTLEHEATLAALPPAWPQELLPTIRADLDAGCKIVVLDDDPTGTQTVADIPVLTGWTVELLAAELANDAAPAFYILTNSRSVPLAEAQALNRTIGHNLEEAAAATGSDFVLVSRSDSTLRGHFPGEMEALATATDRQYDAWLIIPFFAEGGRLTIDDIHYITEGGRLIPAAQTPLCR